MPLKTVTRFDSFVRHVLMACTLLVLPAESQSSRSGTLSLPDENGNITQLYGGSYALLVGVSSYTDGWTDLDQIPGELKAAKEALEAHGFDVTLELDKTDARALRSVYEDFINAYGYNETNRLVFIYSGHGHTWVDGNQGYLVPSDAPKPQSDGNPGTAFLRKAIQISQLVEWSRQMTAKHALFLFDSCFSGTIFKTRGVDIAPPVKKRFRLKSAERPVRQFITAGSADEEVPAKSVFMPTFVNAITFGEGDFSGDGIITGNELGVYLENEVPQWADQSPQFGKHPEHHLAQGNFVFKLDADLLDSQPVDKIEVARSAEADTNRTVERTSGTTEETDTSDSSRKQQLARELVASRRPEVQDIRVQDGAPPDTSQLKSIRKLTVDRVFVIDETSDPALQLNKRGRVMLGGAISDVTYANFSNVIVLDTRSPEDAAGNEGLTSHADAIAEHFRNALPGVNVQTHAIRDTNNVTGRKHQIEILVDESAGSPLNPEAVAQARAYARELSGYAD